MAEVLRGSGGDRGPGRNESWPKRRRPSRSHVLLAPRSASITSSPPRRRRRHHSARRGSVPSHGGRATASTTAPVWPSSPKACAATTGQAKFWWADPGTSPSASSSMRRRTSPAHGMRNFMSYDRRWLERAALQRPRRDGRYGDWERSSGPGLCRQISISEPATRLFELLSCPSLERCEHLHSIAYGLLGLWLPRPRNCSETRSTTSNAPLSARTPASGRATASTRPRNGGVRTAARPTTAPDCRSRCLPPATGPERPGDDEPSAS